MALSRLRLGRLRQRDITLIIVGLTVLLGVLWYFYLYTPVQDEIEELHSRVDTLSLQVQRGEAARRNLPGLREEIAELDQQRQDFLRQLPTQSDVSDLLDLLRESAIATQVTLNSLGQSSAGPEQVENVRPLGFTMSTTGTFAQTMAFLEELETLERFTKVRQVSISVDGSDSANPANPDLITNYGFTVYVYTGDISSLAAVPGGETVAAGRGGG